MWLKLRRSGALKRYLSRGDLLILESRFLGEHAETVYDLIVDAIGAKREPFVSEGQPVDEG
jgi:hypothetical protein